MRKAVKKGTVKRPCGPMEAQLTAVTALWIGAYRQRGLNRALPTLRKINEESRPDDDDDPNDHYEAGDKQVVYDRKLEADKAYQQEQANGAIGDPTSRRFIGANGYAQRKGQKDQLENLHIAGNDHSAQGGNDHETPGEQAAGPGFEKEGSVDLGNPIRSRDQDFGENRPSGPARAAQD